MGFAQKNAFSDAKMKYFQNGIAILTPLFSMGYTYPHSAPGAVANNGGHDLSKSVDLLLRTGYLHRYPPENLKHCLDISSPGKPLPPQRSALSFLQPHRPGENGI